jgi:hypothetical protein
MKCEDLQFNLPLYAEEILTDDERRLADAHLSVCPVCRVKLTELKTLQNDLRGLSAVQVPADLLYKVKNSVSVELRRNERRTSLFSSTVFRHWLQYKLMPYSVGTVASVLITFSFLLIMLSTKEATEKGVEKARLETSRPVIMASNANPKMPDVSYGGEYGLNDLPVGYELPSVNPTGALVALTKSIVRGKMKDEEVVVVADVFGNGIAKIAEVVEPPHDERAMQNLENALNKNDSSAPFVPASKDKRADVVRVIFKIQRVDVVDKTAKNNSKYH